ncbi:MAG: hypothetical protein MIO93_15285, partial [ANME-2 cluster archaeon]|nr:hypothetical protein [ANME-2 cluster archaeon]
FLFFCKVGSVYCYYWHFGVPLVWLEFGMLFEFICILLLLIFLGDEDTFLYIFIRGTFDLELQ